MNYNDKNVFDEDEDEFEEYIDDPADNLNNEDEDEYDWDSDLFDKNLEEDDDEEEDDDDDDD
jgi:hypothetical protein